MFQALIHPAQDRLLTIRESARLQGFPDNYRFRGTVKDRYLFVFTFFILSDEGLNFVHVAL